MSQNSFAGPPVTVGDDRIDLIGATVIHVHPGDKLVFVASWDPVEDEGEQMLATLRKWLPGVDVRLVVGINTVVVQDAEPDLAAIAAACTCAGCMTGGRCVEDPADDGEGERCRFCPHDCQICSDTPHCDCPTHGGES